MVVGARQRVVQHRQEHHTRKDMRSIETADEWSVKQSHETGVLYHHGCMKAPAKYNNRHEPGLTNLLYMETYMISRLLLLDFFSSSISRWIFSVLAFLLFYSQISRSDACVRCVWYGISAMTLFNFLSPLPMAMQRSVVSLADSILDGLLDVRGKR
jgi:hypothetical protein